MVHRVGRSICPGTREHPLGGHTTPPLTRTVYGPTQRVGVGNCTRSSHHDSHHDSHHLTGRKRLHRGSHDGADASRHPPLASRPHRGATWPAPSAPLAAMNRRETFQLSGRTLRAVLSTENGHSGQSSAAVHPESLRPTLWPRQSGSDPWFRV